MFWLHENMAVEAYKQVRELSPYSYLASSVNSFNDYNPKIHNSGNESTAGNADVEELFQVLGLSFVSILGSMGSIFIISAITVIDTLQVRGNVFLVSLTLSHLMITMFVLPTSCIAIMARIDPNDPNICHYQWLITLSTLIISVLSFLFISIENLKGITSLNTYDFCCTKFKIVVITLIIWFGGISVSIAQHYYHYGPSVCQHERDYPIHIPYHASVCIGVLLIPTIITLICFTRSFFIVKYLRQQLQNNPTEDPWAYMLTDESLLKSNMWVYLSSFLMCTPLCIVIVVSVYQQVPQQVLNTCWYIALANSCIYSFIYAASNKEFAEAFFKLFYYCCCKSHVTWTRKGVGPRRATSDQVGLRVHIIPGLNMYAQRREATSAVSARISGSGHHYSSYISSSGGPHSSHGMIGGSGPFARSFARNVKDNYKTSGVL